MRDRAVKPFCEKCSLESRFAFGSKQIPCQFSVPNFLQALIFVSCFFLLGFIWVAMIQSHSKFIRIAGWVGLVGTYLIIYPILTQ